MTMRRAGLLAVWIAFLLSPPAAAKQQGEDLRPEQFERRRGGEPGRSGRRPGGSREDWKPRPAKLSDWKITAEKETVEEKGGRKILRYSDKVKAEMGLPGGMRLLVEAPRLVVMIGADGDTIQRVEAAGGFKASAPPRPGALEADEFEMTFDSQGWPTKVRVPKEVRLSGGFGPINFSARAAMLEVEMKDSQPQKGFARDVSFEVRGTPGAWSGGSLRVKEIRGSRDPEEILFEKIAVDGEHTSGGFSAKADHGRARSRRLRLFGNVSLSIGDKRFDADVLEVGEGEPVIEGPDDKEILEEILRTIGARR
jgi:hypothetical protein